MCKICKCSRNKAARKYYKKNKEVIAKKGKIYRQKNIDAIRATQKKYHNENKEARNAKCKKYYKNNRDAYIKLAKKYQEENKEKIKMQKREYYPKYRETHKEYLREKGREYRLKNKDYIKQWHHEYNQKNKVRLRKRRREYAARRRNVDPNYKLAGYIRMRICNALKGRRKAGNTPSLLGCTIPELRTHLEKQFQPGMIWQNYGKWHVDHKSPCTSYDLIKPGEQKVCFNYMNLQPLWASENQAKGNRIQ